MKAVGKLIFDPCPEGIAYVLEGLRGVEGRAMYRLREPRGTVSGMRAEGRDEAEGLEAGPAQFECKFSRNV